MNEGNENQPGGTVDPLVELEQARAATEQLKNELSQRNQDVTVLEEKVKAAAAEIETRKGEIVALRGQLAEAHKLTDAARNELANSKYGSQTPPDLRTN
jgi:multidrug resistance efflux pump